MTSGFKSRDNKNRRLKIKLVIERWAKKEQRAGESITAERGDGKRGWWKGENVSESDLWLQLCLHKSRGSSLTFRQEWERAQWFLWMSLRASAHRSHPCHTQSFTHLCFNEAQWMCVSGRMVGNGQHFETMESQVSMA